MDTLEVISNKNFTDMTKDLEFWMTNLPQTLRTLPIIQLAIPGSHNSITYGITETSQIAPDAEPIIQRLKFLGPILTAIMAKWCKTQVFNVTKQLMCGIRYFDFRISTKEEDDLFYFVHGMYSEEVTKVLEEIKAFLETHPKEMVILDCQHFYAFQQNDHERLMHLLTFIFSLKLLPYSSHMEHISLQYMTTECKYQAIIIYRSDAARFGQPLLWPSFYFPTPWADTVSVSKLLTFLNDQLQHRNNQTGFISQCILTPTPWFIIKHLFSSLKKQCLIPLEKRRNEWLDRQHAGLGGVNIIISDFIDVDNASFAKSVIQLNRKLLQGENRAEMTPIDNTR